jgi:predicted esterase
VERELLAAVGLLGPRLVDRFRALIRNKVEFFKGWGGKLRHGLYWLRSSGLLEADLRSVRAGVFALCVLLAALTASAKEKVTKFAFQFQGKSRTYYSFVPEIAGAMPVVVLLHGSGRNGQIMADAWKDLAAKEHFIVAAPDAWDSAGWSTQADPPAFLHAVVEQVAAQHPIDQSRIYLFGHSAGAVFSLVLALIDSEYYAAAAVHAGTLSADQYNLFQYAERKMPVAIWVGDRDSNFPLDLVNATKKEFDKNRIPLELTLIANHDHNYYAISDEVNRKAWEFLKKSRLEPPVAEDKQ